MSISIDIANASEAKELTTIALESKQYWGYSSDFIEMCRDELTLKEADFVNSLILVAKNNEKNAQFGGCPRPSIYQSTEYFYSGNIRNSGSNRGYC